MDDSVNPYWEKVYVCTYAQDQRVSVCASVCSVAQITRHISSLESRRSPFRLPPSDLTRRPRVEEARLSLAPRLVSLILSILSGRLEILSSFLSFTYFFIHFVSLSLSLSLFRLTRKIAINVIRKCKSQNCKIWIHFVNIIP